jgi:hypothetical protein
VFGNWRVVGEAEARDGTYITLGDWTGAFGANKEESIVLYVHDNEAETSFKDWFMRDVDPQGVLAGQGGVIVADLKNNWKLRYIAKPFTREYITDQSRRGLPACRYYLSPPSANYFVALCEGKTADLAAHGLEGTFEDAFMLDIANSLSES